MTEAAPRTSGRPRSTTVYIWLVSAGAALLLAVSWVMVGPPQDLLALAILVMLGVLSNRLRELDVGSRVSFSFLSIVMVASIVLVGPVGSALVGGFAYGIELRRQPLRARVFNTSMTATYGVVGAMIYLLVGGADDLGTLEGPGQLFVRVGIPLMVADVAQMLTNAALLSGIVRLDSGVPFRRFFIQMVTNSGIAYIGYGFIGFLFVILWVPADVGPFSALLILAPLYVARWAFVQYGDEQRAHESTLNALVTAVEVKDPSAMGHSGRVAQLSEWIAQPLALGAQEVESLRFAAMLHDVGKVGLPTRLVLRPSAVGEDALAVYETHPALGVEVLAGIEFLESSLEGVKHHHERWDGSGYPGRFSGAQIPAISRIISVADAFDALTTARPDRPPYSADEALLTVEGRAGTQFDPDVVRALRQSIERHGWAPRPLDPDALEAMTGYVDHDDPIAWGALQSRLAHRSESLPKVRS